MTIKDAAAKSSYSQARIARALGVPTRTLEDWIAGKRSPKLGEAYWVERIGAVSTLSPDGLQALIDGVITMDEALHEAKITHAKRMSKWGACADTFRACWEQLPASAVDKLTPAELAEIVDAIHG